MGKCARKACNSAEQGYVHKDTGLWYCAACARNINKACGQELVRRKSHYQYLEEVLPQFFKEVGVDFNANAGIIVAHGDKCYGYKDMWEKGGLHFYYGVAIYLLTYCRPYSKEVRDSSDGWVDPGKWVLANKDRFLKFLPIVR